MKLLSHSVFITFLLIVFQLYPTQVVFSQEVNLGEEMVSKPKKFIGWGDRLGLTVGYERVHSPLDGDKFVDMAPRNLIGIDAMIYPVYFGISSGSHRTGYDVYGYDELVKVFSYRLGPIFRMQASDAVALTLAPFFGGINVSVGDESKNDIGARTKYGTHEKKFVAGARIGFRYKALEVAVIGSSRELGIHVGTSFDIIYMLKYM